MIWWRVKQKVKRLRYRLHNFTERVLRSILRLPRHRFDSIENWLDPAEDDQPYRRVNGEKLSAHLSSYNAKFHAQPRREQYLEKFLRFVFYNGAYNWPGKIRSNVRHAITMFLFYKAREFKYDSHHYNDRKDNWHIDGYLQFKVWGLKRTLTLDICGMDSVVSDITEDDKKAKFVDINKYGSWGFTTLMIPKPKFDIDDVDPVIRAWYADKVEWKYRHFYNMGEDIKITYDWKFTDDLCKTCYRDILEDGCACEDKAEGVEKSSEPTGLDSKSD